MSNTELNRALLDKALEYLTRREYAEHELSEKLMRKGFLQQDIQVVIAYLQSQNLQSDARFIEQMVRTRVNQGYGRLKVISELHMHHLNDDDILPALDQIDWHACLQQLLAKKLKSYNLNDTKQKFKLMRYVINRGYSIDEFNNAVESYYEDSE